MPKTHFSIQVASSDGYLSLEEIWPNGDAPANPTIEDVMTQIRKSGSPERFARDWNFALYVEVDGRNVDFR